MFTDRGRTLTDRGTNRTHFSETEIENFGVSAISHEKICRLNIAMDDTFGMGGFESVGNLDTDVEEALKFEWAAKEQLFECLPFQVLHNNEGPSVIFANFVDGADIWMVQPDAARASRRKRSRACESCATASGRNFKATKRPSGVSSARYTTPMP